MEIPQGNSREEVKLRDQIKKCHQLRTNCDYGNDAIFSW